jgi:NAD(P)-dependent dehydrogenase (short-subunit alcohol dehydrogenase family)
MAGEDLAGRTALVTGAGSGLGAGIARRLAAAGAAVVCVDLDADAATSVASAIDEQGGAAEAVQGDVTNAAAMEEIARRAHREHGRIEIAVANAGIEGPGTVLSTSPEAWERVLAVNLTGVWLTARSVLPMMVEQGGGSIVATASLAGLVGIPNIASYAAAKGGVIALVRQMAADFASSGIRVNAICPGTVPTPLVHRSYASSGGVGTGDSVEERLRTAAARYPLGRVGTVEDIAEAVLYLASDRSGWVTGIALPVDGGLSAT